MCDQTLEIEIWSRKSTRVAGDIELDAHGEGILESGYVPRIQKRRRWSYISTAILMVAW